MYKVENYLCRCIDSILNQSFVDFELILVDDGSPDCCGSICDEYAKKDSRVTVIHKKNGGLSDARNAGLDFAMGDYILFVDSDDYIDADLLEQTYSAASSEDTLVGFGFYSESEDGRENKENIGLVSERCFFNHEERMKFICNELTDCRIPWTAWSKLYSKKIIDKYNIRFADNSEIFAEDLFFILCYFPYVNKIVVLEKALYHYLIRTDSIMGTEAKQSNLGRFEQLVTCLKNRYQEADGSDYYYAHYSLIYFKVMYHGVKMIQRAFPQITDKEIRDIVLQEVSNISCFKQAGKSVWRRRSYLYNSYTPNSRILESISSFLFYGDGNYIRYAIINRMIYKQLLK